MLAMQPSKSYLPLVMGLSLCAAAQSDAFDFAHEGVLGTSFDLSVRAGSYLDAGRFEAAVLGEIGRLASIVSTYDRGSELSQLKVGRKTKVSPELLELLGLYEQWEDRSGGSVSGRLGGVTGLWNEAVRTQSLPDAATLNRALAEARAPAWRLDATRGTAQRLSETPLNVDAIGKGWVIQKSLTAAMRSCPGVVGAMLNIGGEIACVGRWTVHVADPLRPADNAAPIATLQLEDQAIATSAAYARPRMIGGRSYSHILDPRTGQPASAVLSASVVAADCATADALATVLSVLEPKRGMRILEQTRGAEGLVVLADGRRIASPGWTRLATTAPAPASQPSVGNPNWAARATVQVTVQIPQVGTGRRVKRPYVAVWVEDEQQRLVRTVAMWGGEAKYQKDLSRWAKASGNTLPKGVSRATRGAGEYQLVWDGRDDRGSFVAAGRYTICVEAIREKGGHESVAVAVSCDGQTDTAQAQGKQELGKVVVQFGAPQQ